MRQIVLMMISHNVLKSSGYDTDIDRNDIQKLNNEDL